MDKNIRNYNSKGEWHGYIEVYNNTTNILYYRTNYKNGHFIGYIEWHSEKLTQYHIR